jgi:hypothetical protein
VGLEEAGTISSSSSSSQGQLLWAVLQVAIKPPCVLSRWVLGRRFEGRIGPNGMPGVSGRRDEVQHMTALRPGVHCFKVPYHACTVRVEVQAAVVCTAMTPWGPGVVVFPCPWVFQCICV